MKTKKNTKTYADKYAKAKKYSTDENAYITVVPSSPKGEAANTKHDRGQAEDDIGTKQTILFFSSLLILFSLSFILKYIFPNVPEYVFEKILMIVLGAFCTCVLWKLSPELREFAKKLLTKISKKEPNISDEKQQ